jgi:hypothetical protein
MMDKFGREWNLSAAELCPECGQPDSCGDCNHEPLSNADFMLLNNPEKLKEKGKKMEVRNVVIEVRHHGSTPWTRECAESIEDALEIAQQWRDSGQIEGNTTIEIEFKAKGITNGEA